MIEIPVLAERVPMEEFLSSLRVVTEFLICKVPNVRGILQFGSTVKFNGGYLRDIDLMIFSDGPHNTRNKMPLLYKNCMYDITAVITHNIETQLIFEAQRGHYDIAQAICNGMLIFQREINWDLYLKSARTIMDNGPTKYLTISDIFTYRSKLTKILIHLRRRDSSSTALYIAAVYDVVYESYMISLGKWRCKGAYRQIEGTEAAAEIEQAILQSFLGDAKGLESLIDNILLKLGGPLYSIIPQ